MSVLERYLPYNESTKGSKERQGLSQGVHFSEESIKRKVNEFEFGALQKKINSVPLVRFKFYTYL